MALFPGRIATFSRALTAQKSQMLAYLVVARLTPVVPSWFINLASPILQVRVPTSPRGATSRDQLHSCVQHVITNRVAHVCGVK